MTVEEQLHAEAFRKHQESLRPRHKSAPDVFYNADGSIDLRPRWQGKLMAPASDQNSGGNYDGLPGDGGFFSKPR
jgi:hypothetical protein